MPQLGISWPPRRMSQIKLANLWLHKTSNFWSFHLSPWNDRVANSCTLKEWWRDSKGIFRSNRVYMVKSLGPHLSLKTWIHPSLPTTHDNSSKINGLTLCIAFQILESVGFTLYPRKLEFLKYLCARMRLFFIMRMREIWFLGKGIGCLTNPILFMTPNYSFFCS